MVDFSRRCKVSYNAGIEGLDESEWRKHEELKEFFKDDSRTLSSFQGRFHNAQGSPCIGCTFSRLVSSPRGSPGQGEGWAPCGLGRRTTARILQPFVEGKEASKAVAPGGDPAGPQAGREKAGPFSPKAVAPGGGGGDPAGPQAERG